MLILIDTNIFYNNWKMSSAMFQVLSNFINNTIGNQLILPFVVFEETQKKYNEEIEKLQKEISQIKGRIKKLSESEFFIDDLNDEIKEFSFQRELLKTFPKTHIISSSYIDNDLLLNKAIFSKRPFRDNEKGYRDALIWNSLTQYLHVEKVKDTIVFITNNSHDFMSTDKKTKELHSDLKEDIANLSLDNVFLLYNSLNEFITEHVDQELHSFKHGNIEEIEERYIEAIEDEFDDFTPIHMNNLSLDECASLYESSGFNGSIIRMCKDFNFDVIEGTEDPLMYSGYKLPGNKYAFEYSYNFRMCSFEFCIDTGIYHQNKEIITKEYMNIEIGQATTKFYSYPRVYFYGSGIIDLARNHIETINLENLDMQLKL
ncbi:PIN domain-containing protein [Leclercia adecarboxylata]|uniref:PIN domain-containing protein n=1 Tax=Leclercia adecarboxylata TaxID=83655 RepID=UPI002DB795F5|nr:PIN domain-containing protein [Leclercia adecarboxylata]MEB6381611.1 PIN domain-containing protein [Leclercia adecarboxylata]